VHTPLNARGHLSGGPEALGLQLFEEGARLSTGSSYEVLCTVCALALHRSLEPRRPVLAQLKNDRLPPAWSIRDGDLAEYHVVALGWVVPQLQNDRRAACHQRSRSGSWLLLVLARRAHSRIGDSHSEGQGRADHAVPAHFSRNGSGLTICQWSTLAPRAQLPRGGPRPFSVAPRPKAQGPKPVALYS
jgi:hypothetical protein